MNYDSKFKQKCTQNYKQVGYQTFFHHIVATWEILKENINKSRNCVFIWEQMNVSINFALEKCMAFYIPIKNSAIFKF